MLLELNPQGKIEINQKLIQLHPTHFIIENNLKRRVCFEVEEQIDALNHIVKVKLRRKKKDAET